MLVVCGYIDNEFSLKHQPSLILFDIWDIITLADNGEKEIDLT